MPLANCHSRAYRVPDRITVTVIRSIHSAGLRHTTGTIKAQEAEIAKITESLRTEGRMVRTVEALADGKSAVKSAKEDLARKAKQVSQANEDILRLKHQLEELEGSVTLKDAKITKLTRALQSKDVLVADLNSIGLSDGINVNMAGRVFKKLKPLLPPMLLMVSLSIPFGVISIIWISTMISLGIL